MGLKNSSNLTYINLSGGRFKLRADEDTPGAVKQTAKDGTTRHYLLFDTLTGYLDGVKVRRNDKFNIDVLEIDIRDDEDNDKIYRVSVSFNSSAARALISQLLSADPARPVEIKTWAEEFDEGKKRTNVITKQDGQVLPWFLLSSRNERAKELPPERIFPTPTKAVINGKEVWDFTEQLNMLRRYVEVLDTKIKGAIVADATEQAEEPFDDLVFEEATPDTKESKDDDDLPF